MSFDPPVSITPDTSDSVERQRFQSRYKQRVWSHKIDGGEHLFCVIFKTNQEITNEQAQQFINWVLTQRPEIIAGGAMLICTLPGPDVLLENFETFFKSTFELVPSLPPPQIPS